MKTGTARRVTAVGAETAAVLGLAFLWPTDVHKTVEKLEATGYQAPYDVILFLGKAGTGESIDALFSILDSGQTPSKVRAAEVLADLARSRWQEPLRADGRHLDEEVVLWLDDTDPTLRRSACDVLGRIGATGHRDRISMMVTDADLDVRAACVRTLLGMWLGAVDRTAVKSVSVQVLSDPYFEVRKNALTGLKLLQVKETFVSVLPLVQSDNSELRKLALDAAVAVSPEQGFPLAVKALGDPDQGVRVVAIRALASTDLPGVVEALTPLLHEPGMDVQVTAALGKVGDPAAVDLLVEALAVPRLRSIAQISLALQGERAEAGISSALMKEGDREILKVLLAVAALHPSAAFLPGLERILAFAPDRKQDVLDVLVGISDPAALHLALALDSDPVPVFRKSALLAAGKIMESTGTDAAAEDVLTDALLDDDLSVVGTAVRLVGRWRVEKAAPFLVPLLDGHGEDMAIASAAALLLLGEDVGVEILVGALASTSLSTRLEAAAALASCHPESAEGPLLDLVQDVVSDGGETGGEPWDVLSFEVLGFVAAGDGATKARESILAILETGDVHERVLAVRAAAASGHPGLAPAVGSVLDGDAAQVRRSAAPWLWRFEGEVGRSLILRALEDDDPMVRALAVLSLGRSDSSDGASRAERLLDLMADPDEIVRLNAAAELSTMGEDILPLTERVCQAYDRSLSTVEALQALHLMALSGAPCLEDRVGRLIFQDGAGRGAVIDATRIGLESGAVSLDENLRMGIESCAAGGAPLQAEACMAILEGGGPGPEGCAGPSPFAVPAAAAPAVAVPPATLAPDLGRGCVLPGLYQVTSAKSFPDGHPIFVVDGTLVIRMTVIESGLGVGLPAPACGDYASAGLLDL